MSEFNIMCRNNQILHYMCHAFIFSSKEMIFTSKEKASNMLENARTQSNKSVACNCKRIP